MSRILITGERGFIGRHLVRALTDHKVYVISQAGAGYADAAINLSTRNTLETAKFAKATGVKRFVHLSTAKVYGENNKKVCYSDFTKGRISPIYQFPFEEEHPYDYDRPQSRGKIVDELTVKGLFPNEGGDSGSHVIIRCPAVYGPGSKNNLTKLFRWSGLPLPLKGIRNHRSIIYVGNLVSALIAALELPSGIYNVSDTNAAGAISTLELVRRYNYEAGRKTRLFKAPWLPSMPKITGDFVLDTSKIGKYWHPPYTQGEGLRLTANT